MAPFIMDFGDLNRYVLRDEMSDEPFQALVNVRTYEDDHHWPSYLDDLAALGHDERTSTTDVLRQLYSDRTAVNRLARDQATPTSCSTPPRSSASW